MLNKKQQNAIDEVINGKNILLTGPAGTGKSFTIQYILDTLKQNNKNYAMTATTGTAAVLIEGQTLHSFMKIGLGNGSLIDNIRRIKRYPNTFKSIGALEVLIIDEVSMLDAELFDKISDIFASVKAHHFNNKDLLLKPFGGLQLILVGDFCQLAPINGLYCFLSKSWDKLQIKTIMLDEIIRQNGDQLFIKLLQIVRKGKCTDNIITVLNKLKNTEFHQDIRPTRLYPMNVDVDKINNEEVLKLKNSGNRYKLYKAKYSSDNSISASLFDVELICGAQVIITRNIDVSKGIVNGKRGVITYLGEENVTIQDVENNTFQIDYYKDVNEKSYNDVRKCYTSFISHMPIKICYALSIHKAQGMTIDALELDLGKNIFTSGQAYTALSRAKSLNSIKIIDVTKESFKINPYVKKFYSNIIE